MPPDVSLLDGVLERVTFANPETGYTIAKIGPDPRTRGGGADLVTAVGPLLGAQVGESLRMRGRWTSHPKYGRQFEVHSYTTVLPATTQGIQRYLGSGLIKGIGPVMAERMVAHFGVDIMHVIENSPGRLVEVEGLGPKRTVMITAAWAEQKAIKEVMVFLQGVGVSTSLAVRIYKKYGDEAISVVRDEPYRLAADVWGIGFKTADTIAAAVGIARDSPERIKAGLAYTLSEAADEGHCYLPAPNPMADAAKILEVPGELITPCLDELAAAEGVIKEAVPAGGPAVPGTAAQVPAVYLPPFYVAERSLASALLRLLATRADRLAAFGAVDWGKALAWLRGNTGAPLAAEQEEAVRLALTSRVAVLTGGPGCGKSFTVRSVVALARAKGATVVLAAPTGRAAKRLAELTGHEAATIHRLLQLRPGGEPSFDAATPLDADLVVVDETSARGGEVDTVGDEPAVLDGRGPVIDPHVRMASAGLDQRVVPGEHAAFRIRSGGEQRSDVHPHDRLVADQRHHLLDPGGQADRRTDGDIRGVVGAQGQHPAPAVPLLDELLGHGVGVRVILVRLDSVPTLTTGQPSRRQARRRTTTAT